MNFVFISPHFPASYWNFCDRLKKNGVNVLAITDNSYESLSPELKGAIHDHVQVSSLENYDEMVRALGYFTWKYGKIDWLESNNEYWLEQDAALRTEFNITSGYRQDRIGSIKSKEAMKKYYKLAGIPVARHHMVSTVKAGKAFIKKVGYPVIVKPNIGVGAADTYKLNNDEDFDNFYQNLPSVPYIMEEFIDGIICTYDGVCDRESNVIFEASNVTPPIMDVVLDDTDVAYYTCKEVPAALSEMGRKTIKAFGVQSRFFHLEFFRLNTAKEGLGKVGDYVALEVNMRPAGGYTPDMINFANSVDCYQIWADMVAFNQCHVDLNKEHYYCAYAGRKDSKHYVHDENEVLEAYRNHLKMHVRMPDVFAQVMGNQMFVCNFDTYEEVEAFIRFVQTQA